MNYSRQETTIQKRIQSMHIFIVYKNASRLRLFEGKCRIYFDLWNSSERKSLSTVHDE